MQHHIIKSESTPLTTFLIHILLSASTTGLPVEFWYQRLKSWVTEYHLLLNKFDLVSVYHFFTLRILCLGVQARNALLRAVLALIEPDSFPMEQSDKLPIGSDLFLVVVGLTRAGVCLGNVATER